MNDLTIERSGPPMTTVTAARIWRGLDEVSGDFGPCVVTIGVFDGVHHGHARLIERAVETGRRRGLPTVLVTFDPHPARVVGPARDTSTLSTLERRADLAGELGVDAVLVLSFTQALARTSPEAFVRSVLVAGLRARAVVIGTNFRFGARAAGTVELLRDLGRRHGFAVEGVDLLHTEQVRCSSTHVRSCLASGNTAAAARALGRPHRVEGRLAGARLDVPPGTAVPAPGRYAGVLTTPGTDGRRVDVLVDADRTIRLTGHSGVPGHPAALDFLPH